MLHVVPPRLGAPVAVAVTALAGSLIVALVDPGRPGRYPVCPFLALTGRYCPGCGGLRAVHALAHGDLGAAADHNVLVVAILPLAVLAWAWWLRRRWRGIPPRPAAPSWWVLALTACGVLLAVAFGVLRNLPAGAWLAP